MVTLLFDLKDLPRPYVHTEATIGYTALGEDHSVGESDVFKTSDEDRGTEVKWCKLSHDLFAEQKIKVSSSILVPIRLGY